MNQRIVKEVYEKKQVREPCRHYILLPTDDDVTGDCQLGEDLDCAVCPYYDSNRKPYDLDLNDVYDPALDNEPSSEKNCTVH